MPDNNFDYLQAIYDGEKDTNANKIGNYAFPDKRIGSTSSPNIVLANRDINNKCDCYKDKLATDIMIYWRDKIDPDSSDAKKREQIQSDIDLFLKDKDMSSYQYLKSAQEKTESPYIEMIINHIDSLVQEYKTEAMEELQNDVTVTKDIPDDEEIPEKNKDVKDDIETKSFIDDLKKKTINSIVSQITKIINDSKETNNMNFSLNANEKVGILEECVLYMSESALRSGKEFKMNDDALELAIRESVMHEFDILFKFESVFSRDYVNRLRANKAPILNKESMQKYNII